MNNIDKYRKNQLYIIVLQSIHVQRERVIRKQNQYFLTRKHYITNFCAYTVSGKYIFFSSPGRNPIINLLEINDNKRSNKQQNIKGCRLAIRRP